MNEMNTVPLSLFIQYSPQHQRAPTKAVSCAHSESGSGPLVGQGRGATTETLVGVTQHLPRSLTEAQPVLGWLTLLCQRESPKACRMACHHVTRAHRSHIYFRNLRFWHEQRFQSFEDMPCLFCLVDSSRSTAVVSGPTWRMGWVGDAGAYVGINAYTFIN